MNIPQKRITYRCKSCAFWIAEDAKHKACPGCDIDIADTIINDLDRARARKVFAAFDALRAKHRAQQKPPQEVKPQQDRERDLSEHGITWPDTGNDNRPRGTCANTRTAIRALGIVCRYDVFHDRMLVGGHIIERWAGELSDHACQMLRVIIRQTYGFEPGRENTHDAAVQLCLNNRFDPVCDYLDALAWDCKPRLDKWLSKYLGAENTPLNRAIGKLGLVAAVRRARQPGCKFDQIIVLEGVEGTNKSTAIEVMAGRENFSDQTILGLRDKEQQEQLKGKWIYEIADLTGIKRADVESVKAFASRTHDRARPAYGRCTIDQPRRCVLFATTNEDTYLQSQTGNRRFWPVTTGHIDIEALRRDRDQLWAEAAHVETTGLSLVLPEKLWGDARAEQDKRREQDTWEDILAHVTGEIGWAIDGVSQQERVATSVLMQHHLKLTPERINISMEKRLAACMRRLRWQGPTKIRIGGKPQRGYWRPIDAEH